MLWAECRCRESRGLVARREAGSWPGPATELIQRDRAGNGSVRKHTLRTVVHDIIVVEQWLTLREHGVLL
jgi:hypothetical protein